jgi:acyl carrier protein
MVPSAFVRLDRLPLKDSNKVDVAALPAPQSLVGADEFVPPRNDDERQIAEIWKDLLGVEQAGVNDNFFELGGHSLLVTRMISRIRSDLGANLSIRQVFRTPALGDLAVSVASARQAADGDDDNIVARPRAGRPA